MQYFRTNTGIYAVNAGAGTFYAIVTGFAQT